ncbi:hypothetical protein GCM10009840_11010 [Pseudolysinimonas kribbensis]|uniref:DUF2127 domain-containing protein n=1 Tax=Pseudolysinimonas kribbensis TaxID=433641 RepID=A0ABQ6KA00_9MICO|nr:DUF2127 domain-containing protein [Pseudolysinimonas kribbensis]GMA95526.1 hypothetical protein GCM10025881_23500 [Pseudolysinimonas kribbensis]
MRPTVRHLLDLLFLIGVVVKGLNGVAELAGGAAAAVLPATTSVSIAHGHLHAHDVPLLVVFLLVHGVVKVAVVVALIVGALRVYPWAIGALAVLTVLQIADLALRPSLGVVLLTILDLIVIALTWREWRAHRSLRQTFAATVAWIRHRPERAG